MLKPTKQLRKYQSDFSLQLAKSVQKHTKVIGCAPTGSGKSLTMITIAWNATQKKRAVFIISETFKIYEQLRDEAGGNIIAEGVKFVNIKDGELYVCMAQTLAKRPLIIEQLNSLETPPIVIVDEAHIGTPTKILEQLNDNIPVIGFTATPDARIAKHLPELYKDCVVCCQVDDLIQQGFLCTYRHVKRDGAMLGVLKKRGGEFTEQSQAEVFGTESVFNALVEDLHKFPYKKCVIYVASIQQATNVATELRNRGIPCVEYHSKMKDGAYQLSRFTVLNEVNVCVSVSSLTKGWDYPPIDLVVLLRKTSSLALFLQMIGRGGRIIVDDNGVLIKDSFTCLDYGGNWEDHGLWWDDRPWDIMWKTVPKKSDDGIAPVVLCDKCDSIHSASQMKCPFCGYERPIKIEVKQIQEAEDVTSPYLQLVGKKLSEVTPEELSVYAKIKSKQAFGARVARTHGAEYLQEFANFMGYKKSWVARQEKLETGFTDFTLR